MSEPVLPATSQEEPGPLAMGCGCLMMLAMAAIFLPIAGGVAYWWFTQPAQASVSFSWTLSPRDSNPLATVDVRGTYMDRMREGDSQLIAFTIRAANFQADDARTVFLRMVGPGLPIEPNNGYAVRVTEDGEQRVTFSVGANGTGSKTALIYPQLFIGREVPAGAVADQSTAAVTQSFPISFIVDRDTTFGLTQNTWTVINIVTLLVITVSAALLSFVTRTGQWIWTTGWKIYENRERIDAFLNEPKE